MDPNYKLNVIFLYSDGCGAQIHNSTLSNALLKLSVENNVCIIKKYLEKGHMHMECDSSIQPLKERFQEG